MPKPLPKYFKALYLFEAVSAVFKVETNNNLNSKPMPPEKTEKPNPIDIAIRNLKKELESHNHEIAMLRAKIEQLRSDIELLEEIKEQTEKQ